MNFHFRNTYSKPGFCFFFSWFHLVCSAPEQVLVWAELGAEHVDGKKWWGTGGCCWNHQCCSREGSLNCSPVGVWVKFWKALKVKVSRVMQRGDLVLGRSLRKHWLYKKLKYLCSSFLSACGGIRLPLTESADSEVQDDNIKKRRGEA